MIISDDEVVAMIMVNHDDGYENKDNDLDDGTFVEAC